MNNHRNPAVQPDDKALAKGEGASTGRLAVLVLGMHRSGTSALARVLSMLGCDLPATLLMANETNVNGHWESDVLREFNDEVLASAGSDWADWAAFDTRWYQSPVALQYQGRIAGLVAQEYGNSPLFVLKDPRNCRLGKLWIGALQQGGIEPLVVMPVRHPLEVADSLAVRNAMDRGTTVLLWLRHVLDAEAASRGLRRMTCSYSQLLENWSGLARRLEEGLGIVWPRMSAATAEQVDAFIAPDARHARHSEDAILDNPLVSHWIRDTYAILMRWAHDREDSADYSRLDAIRQGFDEAVPVFEMAIRQGDEHRKNALSLKRDLDATLALAQARADRIDVVQIEREAALSELAQVKAAAAAWSSAADEAGGAVAGMAGERDKVQLWIATLEQQMAQSEARLEAELAKIEALQRDNQALADESGGLASEVRQRQEEVAQAWAEVAALKADGDGLRLALAKAQAGWEQEQDKRAAADKWVFDLSGQREAALKALANATQREAALVRKLDVAVARQLRAEEGLTQERNLRASLEMEHRIACERLVEQRKVAEHEAGLREAARSGELAEVAALLMASEQRVREADQAAATAAQAVAALTQKETRGAQDMVALTRMLQQEETARARAVERAEIARKIYQALAKAPYWWGILPPVLRRRLQWQRLARRGLFDARAYLMANPDVAEAGHDPVTHYVAHGLAEGRQY